MINSKQPIKILSWIIFLLSLILLGLCIRAAYVTYLFPVYPDEIAENILLTRFGYDFPIKFDLMPMCRAISPAYPKWWYFPAFLEWLLYGHTFNLKVFRSIGIITSWLIFILLSVQIYRKNINLFKTNLTKILFYFLALGCVLALFNIGVVPFSLVTNRPEAGILLLLIISIMLFEIPVKNKIQSMWIALGFFVCVSLLFYSHAKTFLLIPFLCIIAHRLFSHFKNTYIYIALWILFVLMAFKNYVSWTNTFTLCPDSPIISTIFSSFNVNLQNIFYAPKQFLLEIYTNLLTYQIDIDRISFQPTTEINYLPPIKVGPRIVQLNTLIYWNYLAIFFLLITANSFSYLRDLLKRKIITTNLLSLTLLICTFISLLINNTKHWYDAGYIWVLLSLAALIYFSEQIPYLLKRGINYFFYFFTGYFLIVAIASVWILIHNYELPLRGGFAGPSIPLANYHYKKLKKQFDQLASECNIDVNNSKNLILDDYTYYHFQKSKYPLSYTYLFYGPDQKFLATFWNKFQIDGIIIRAAPIPEKVRKYSVQIDGVLCVPKKNIRPFFMEMFGIQGK